MTTEEALFEVWFQLHRRDTFKKGQLGNDRLEDHPNWSMGLRPYYLEGWMARATMHITWGDFVPEAEVTPSFSRLR